MGQFGQRVEDGSYWRRQNQQFGLLRTFAQLGGRLVDNLLFQGQAATAFVWLYANEQRGAAAQSQRQ
jgi:hypothetical protein